ncbi:DEAD-box ATP-dependent RNA helicase 31-like [Coffea eugenioides]|uniref:DEAD-box ATP-dependent RNA helicase 31-like n=1 Tax=Coffea eugenioides TaxID=49369 RepID=UPI000F607BC4|nr:DEAD-box ATP-dependent RNA helicase 31-like [Coffea eugenioides]
MPLRLSLFPGLRPLNPSLAVAHFTSMMSIPPLKPTRPVPIFSRVFPLRLKYHSVRFPILSTNGHDQEQQIRTHFSSTRKLSTRGRTSSATRPSSKSLIEDEADLSDWVSGLSSKSFSKTQVFSDSEDDDSKGNSLRNRTSGGGVFSRDRVAGNWGKRGREERGGKRRRDGDSDDFQASNRRGGPRDLEGSFPRRKGKFSGGEWGAEDDKEPIFRRRGRENAIFSRERAWGSDDRFSRGPRGNRLNDVFSREEARDSNEIFSRGSRDRKNGSDLQRARLSNKTSSRGLRDRRKNGAPREQMEGIDMNYGRNARGKGAGRGKSIASDEEDDEDEEEDEEEKGYMRFKELIDSEESSEELNDDDDDVGNYVSEKESAFSQGEGDGMPKASPSSSSERSDSYLSETRFEECSISPLSIKALKDVGYERMTVVQEATLPVILKGKDVLAKAKTGTGKTVAFLLPSIEVITKSPPAARDQKRPPILVLVICPTRELASQAATEANTLLKYHPSIGVQVVIGGTRLALEQKRMQANPCQILVATPGRLRDHIENTAGFATRLMGVKVLVLDEADHLLDMGFRKDIERIIDAVPKQRQTLLFSATIPQEVRHICHIALKRDHEFINTVQEGSEETHSQVRQMHMVAPLDKHFTLLYTLLKEHIADDVDYKVLVFCTTAMVTRLVADLLAELNLNVREIHSRKPQSYRTRISDEFRKSKGLILVTSDVSARGVDYPDVTLVVQIGLPADRQQYIHRLGRTGRKGKEGQGMLLLAPWEEFFLSTIKDLPTTKAEVPLVDPDTRKKVERALSHVEMKNKEAAYQAWLGYYNSNKTVGRDKYRLVELANEFSRSMGLDNPPAIPKLVLGKMGLRNIPGLRSK